MFLRTGDHLATLQQLAEYTSGRQLTFVGTDLVNLVNERIDTAVESVERHGTDQVSPLAQAACLDERIYTERRHELRTVEQRQTLLRLQGDRLPTELFEHLLCRTNRTLVLNFAQTEQRQAHVGQRCEVPRSAQRTVLENNRQHVVVEEVDQTLYGLELYTRVTVRKRLDLGEQHQLHDLRRNALARTTGVRHNQVLLQLRKLILVDRDVTERTETGRNTVDRLLLRLHLAIEVLAATYDARLGILAQFEFIVVLQNLANTVNSQVFGTYLMNHCRMNRLKFSFI